MCPAENAQTLLQSKCSKCTSIKSNCDNNKKIRFWYVCKGLPGELYPHFCVGVWNLNAHAKGISLANVIFSSQKLASSDCTSVYQPPNSTTQSHICLYLLRASYHPSFLPLAPPGGGRQPAVEQFAACECSECAQYLLRCSNKTITETETLVTDIELYDKRKHPKERKLFTSETPEVRTVFQIIKNRSPIMRSKYCTS